MKKLYLHTSAAAISDYSSMAAIVPAQYIKNRVTDIQPENCDLLLLSNKIYSDQEDISIEIQITDTEAKKLTNLSDDYFYYQGWLPFSRITKIIFKTKELLENKKFDASLGAFLPEYLLVYLIESNTSVGNFKNHKKDIKSVKNLSTEIRDYDRILGSVCFSNILLENYNDENVNASKVFLSLVSFFYSEIEVKCNESNIEIENKFKSIFKTGGPFTETKELLLTSLDKETIEKLYSEKHQTRLPKKVGSIDIDRLDSKDSLYLPVVISSYGKGGSFKVADFISHLINGKFTNKKEALSIFLGYYYGYSLFKPNYKTSTFSLDIKLKFESQFDFQIIEKIYGHVTKQKSNEEFNYSFIPHPNSSINEIYNYSYCTIDNRTFILKKHDGKDVFSKLLFEFVNRLKQSLKDSFISINEDSSIEKSIIDELSESLYNEIVNPFKSQIQILENTIIRLRKINQTPNKQLLENDKLNQRIENATSFKDISAKTQKNKENNVKKSVQTINKSSKKLTREIEEGLSNYKIYESLNIEKQPSIADFKNYGLNDEKLLEFVETPVTKQMSDLDNITDIEFAKKIAKFYNIKSATRFTKISKLTERIKEKLKEFDR